MQKDRVRFLVLFCSVLFFSGQLMFDFASIFYLPFHVLLVMANKTNYFLSVCTVFFLMFAVFIITKKLTIDERQTNERLQKY